MPRLATQRRRTDAALATTVGFVTLAGTAAAQPIHDCVPFIPDIDAVTVSIAGCTGASCATVESTCFEMVYEAAVEGPAADPTNYPDGPVRVFRRQLGGGASEVQLIIQSSGWYFDLGFENGNYRMVGADFDSLVLDTDPIMDSVLDPNACTRDDLAWVSAPWIAPDGDIHAVIHKEYRGEQHSRLDFNPPTALCGNGCATTRTCCRIRLDRVCPSGDVACRVYHCLWTNFTYAVSTDGGASYLQAGDTSPGTPPEFLAGVPYKYGPEQNDRRPYRGVYEPSNICKHPTTDYYYMIAGMHLPQEFQDSSAEFWGGIEQAFIMRTKTPDDPASWRAWSGKHEAARPLELDDNWGCDPLGGSISSGDPVGPLCPIHTELEWDVELADPYPLEPSSPDLHVPRPLDPFWWLCDAPRAANFRSSLSWSDYLGAFILMGEGPLYDDVEDRYFGTIYYSISKTLTDWSEARELHPCLRSELWDEPLYPVLVDHDSTSDNFDTVGQEPYLYFRRFSEAVGYWGFDILRVQLHFDA